ncbi:MAG: sigma factor-like helix-turn-helix DNA-binding protein, partial [Myxococcota bacterium]
RHLEAEDVRRHVERALDNMNARYARALRLRLLEDRSREECAELMDVTVGNFDVILHRAAKAFRKVYDA